MNKFFKVIKNPAWAADRIREKYLIIPEYKRIHLSSFKNLLLENGYDFADYNEIINEFQDFSEVHNYVNRQFSEAEIRMNYPPEKYSWPSLLYYIIRKERPEIIVETGCWYGNSTTCMLAALHQNDRGKLYTIDLPALFENGGYTDANPYVEEKKRTNSLPAGRQPGFIVPDFLKNKWKLIEGPSSEKLIPLLEELGTIDIFLHDSLHSVENMNFEFRQGYKFLKNGGMFLSDNIDWNNVFHEFSANKTHSSYLAYYETKLLKSNFGLIIKKQTHEYH